MAPQQPPPGVDPAIWWASPAGIAATRAAMGMAGPVPAMLAPQQSTPPPPETLRRDPLQGLADFAHDVGPGRLGDPTTAPRALLDLGLRAGMSRADPYTAPVGPPKPPPDLRWTKPAQAAPESLKPASEGGVPPVVRTALGLQGQEVPPEMRSGVSVSRSGPSRPGELGRILKDLQTAEAAEQQRMEDIAAPYQEPAQTEEGKLIDVEGPGSRAALVDEFQELAAKGTKSDAELRRMTTIGELLKADTAEARVAREIAVESERARQVGELDRQAQQARQDAMARIEEQTKLLAEASRRFSEAKVDPDRLLGSAGSRAAAAIGIALGAMGAALARTPNFAQQVISEAIDRDIRAQEANISKLGASARMQESLLGQYRQIFRDDEVAREAARVTMHRAFDAKLKALNLEYAPQETKDRLVALGAANETASAQALRAMQQKTYDNHLRTKQLEANVAAQRATLQMQRSAMAARSGPAPDSTPSGLEIIPGKTPTKKQQEKAEELWASYGEFDGIMQQAEALRDEFGNDITPEARARGDVLAGHLTRAIANIQNAGANLTEAEIALIGTPKNIVEWGMVATRLNQLRQIVESRTNARLRAYNHRRRVMGEQAFAPK